MGERTRATPPATIKAAAETPLAAAPPVYGIPVAVGVTTTPVPVGAIVGAAYPEGATAVDDGPQA